MYYDYPESMTFLPFVKYVVTQKRVAPYLFVTGGYEVEWGADNATNAWILGLGGGVHIRVAERFTVNVELGALHYWYANKKVYWYPDEDILRIENSGVHVHGPSCRNADDCLDLAADITQEGQIVVVDSEGNRFLCNDAANCEPLDLKDKKDVDREWYFPLVSIGFSVHF